MHNVGNKCLVSECYSIVMQEIMKVIQYLVKQGADPNAENKFSWTPLHYAAVRGNEVVAKVLLDLKGIKINVCIYFLCPC